MQNLISKSEFMAITKCRLCDAVFLGKKRQLQFMERYFALTELPAQVWKHTHLHSWLVQSTCTFANVNSCWQFAANLHTARRMVACGLATTSLFHKQLFRLWSLGLVPYLVTVANPMPSISLERENLLYDCAMHNESFYFEFIDVFRPQVHEMRSQLRFAIEANSVRIVDFILSLNPPQDALVGRSSALVEASYQSNFAIIAKLCNAALRLGYFQMHNGSLVSVSCSQSATQTIDPMQIDRCTPT